jgi:hypothetical protein
VHGITVTRRPTHDSGDPQPSEVSVRRISIRYADGSEMSFIPEAGERFFSQDDVQRVVGILRKASAALEWGQMPKGYPLLERGGGLI